MVEITSEEQNKVKRMKRTQDSLRDLWDNITTPHHIRIIGVSEEEEKKKEYEKIFEEMIVDGKRNSTEVQEAQRVPYRTHPKGNMPRHILIKLMKIKWKENY